MDYMTKFIENFNFLKGNKSTNEIAKECGIPQQTLSRYLTLKSEIKLNNLCILADYFAVSIDELVGRVSE